MPRQPRAWRRALRRKLTFIGPEVSISIDAREVIRQLDAGMVDGWRVDGVSR